MATQDSRTAFTKDKGHFTIHGCGDDHDFLPGVLPDNRPDPYLKIYHQCNDDDEMTRIDLPRVFSPKKQKFRRPIFLDLDDDTDESNENTELV
ncbi:unnamed protein product, partial [Mesorhabditis spiculigera]